MSLSAPPSPSALSFAPCSSPPPLHPFPTRRSSDLSPSPHCCSPPHRMSPRYPNSPSPASCSSTRSHPKSSLHSSTTSICRTPFLTTIRRTSPSTPSSTSGSPTTTTTTAPTPPHPPS